jgi:excinuclease ABC subunit C
MKPKTDKLKEILRSLPQQPGVYQYYDENDKLLYIGKAKNLKKRVSSYFSKNRYDSGKTAALVRKITNIRFIIVETELDALLLENNLIKKYQPRYNIEWRDDKSYPFICIKKERFPRIFPTRNVVDDGSEYFGPYASVKRMHELLELIRQLYPLRNCNFSLSEKNIASGKFKVCLEYHLGNCKGACEGMETEAAYLSSVEQVRELLKGQMTPVLRSLKTEMKTAAEALQFEQANALKQKIHLLENYQTKSTIVSPTINNVDVFSIITEERYAFVNFMKVINGAIVQGHTLEFKKQLEESDLEVLQVAITELRQRFKSKSPQVIVPFDPEMEIEGLSFLVPQRGDKKKLLDLSLQNVKFFMLERRRQVERVDPDRHKKRLLNQMKKDLRLPELPVHIECFDNSNIQGTHPVAACVVFKDGKPSKKDYRHFNIKTVEGPNDFASMEEVLLRRYGRLKKEGASLPQLIIVDGGKGQLSAAVKSLDELELRGKISIIGIAKRLEELYYPGDPVPLYLDKKSETLKVIQHLRNEAHRFGITHHRNKRSKTAIASELTNIKGIGEQSAQALLRHFKSVKRLKEANEKALLEVVDQRKAKLLLAHFNNANQEG